MNQVVAGIWTVFVVFQTAGVRQRNSAFGDTSQNRSPHIGGRGLPETGGIKNEHEET